MLKSGGLISFLAATLDNDAETVRANVKQMQAEGLVSLGTRGRNGGVALTESDCVNALIANALSRKRGEDIAALTRKVRDLPWAKRMALPDENFIQGLTCFFAETAGTAIDALVSDLRTGRLSAWTGHETADIHVSFDARGESVSMNVWLPKRHATDVRTAVQHFGLDYDSRQPVTRQVSIRGEWFEKLANMLGPAEPAIAA